MSKAILDRNIRPAVLGVDDIGETQNIGMDVDSKSLNVNSRVWDSDLMRWVRMTQPTGGGTVELPTYNDSRVVYDVHKRIQYYGEHEILGAPEDDLEWQITRIDYNDDGMISRLQTREGPWSEYLEGWS